MTFPVELLRPSDTAMCLFVAAFGGAQDLRYVRDAGVVDAICIDTDGEKLAAMKPDYPASYVFHRGDAYQMVLRMARRDYRRWPDVVTADPWSGDADVMMRTVLLPLTMIARRALILGCGNAERAETIRALRILGYQPRVIDRTGLACWIVVEK